MQPWELITTIIITVVGSSWFGTWVSNLTSKKDIIASIQALEKKVDDNQAKREQKDAEQMRSKILRFDDELRQGLRHSQEYFEDILKDITEYEDYCLTHASFKNKRAESGISHIMKAYDKAHSQNDFL